MSYTFAISRKTLPESVLNPCEWINSEVELAHSEDQNPHDEFLRLHNTLTDKYPCMCDMDEDDIDECVWSDGPLINNFSKDIAVLGMTNSAASEFGGDIYDMILENGFWIFDYQSSSIYQPVK